VTSRGCPFKCIFCAEPSFHGANMRYASVDRVVEHVASLKEKYDLSVLTIYDDQILMNRARAKDLFSKLAPLKIRIEMPNGVTLSYIDEELAGLMKTAGVDTIFLAIEHGSKRVLKDIIHKPIAFNRIKPTIQLLQDAGIFTCAFFVIGLPGETRNERQETRDAIFDWGLDWAFFNYATPLRGSELFRLCKENKWIDEKYLPIGAIDMTEYVITGPGMDRQEIKETVFDMNLDLNFVNNHNLRKGNLSTAYQAFREVVDRHPGQPFAQYFLARCLEDMNAGTAKIEKHYKNYQRIIQSSETWRSAAKKFGLELEPECRPQDVRLRA
jgi:anaerobic magnesium-protoporphyrin IX monomethyl ester cyclase